MSELHSDISIEIDNLRTERVEVVRQEAMHHL